jgi:tryptophanyl-tRNA synthetase
VRFSEKKRVFSGIQPTGSIHIGNYLGAIRHWVTTQAQFENIFCIVDLHAISIPREPKTLKSKTREIAALLLASGVDPKRSAVFVQSQISAHAELAWILSCIIPMGWMERMTQFKEKSQRQKQSNAVGLFIYPALMAADILLYQADLVPVGADQKQHLERTRDVARRFNLLYGQTFTLPEPSIPKLGARIMALDDPTKKMSKSALHSAHAIGLLDSSDEIRLKVMSAVTDSRREIRFDASRPGIYNLLTIYQLFTGFGTSNIEARFAGKGYAEFKRELAELIIENLQPLQSRYRALTAEAGYVDSVLAEGAWKVRPLAEKTLAMVRDKIGLG